MARYIKTAMHNFMHGMAVFVRPIGARNHDSAEDLRPQSIDRYFANVGKRLISARNRFEREYMGGNHANA